MTSNIYEDQFKNVCMLHTSYNYNTSQVFDQVKVLD